MDLVTMIGLVASASVYHNNIYMNGITIQAQKRMFAIRSQMFFGGTAGNSVSSGVGMPCIYIYKGREIIDQEGWIMAII